MRQSKVFAVVGVLLFLVSAGPAFAVPAARDGDVREPIVIRFVRAVRKAIIVKSHGDWLKPPMPAPCAPGTTCP
jgi:hypothetical protein